MTHQSEPIPPPVPAEVDLQDFPCMMIDIPRLFGSTFDAMDDDTAWRCGVTLWLKSFHQVPAASLEDDDAWLAKQVGFGRGSAEAWAKVKALALHGWIKASDGRLYHPVVAETALEAWLEKLSRTMSSGQGNKKRWGTPFDPAPVEEMVRKAAACLAALDPNAKALKKAFVINILAGRPVGSPDGSPDAIPAGSDARPGGKSRRSGRDLNDVPTGMPTGSHRQSRRDPNRREGIKDRKLEPHGSNVPIRREDASALGERSPPSGWQGDAALRADILEHKGVDWCHAYLDHNGWRDLPEKAIVCRTGVCADELRRSCRTILATHGVVVVVEKQAVAVAG